VGVIDHGRYGRFGAVSEPQQLKDNKFLCSLLSIRRRLGGTRMAFWIVESLTEANYEQVRSMRSLGYLRNDPRLRETRPTATCLRKVAKICLSRLMSRRCVASLVAAFLLALTGCTPVKVRLGWKVYLDKIPISSIEASLPKGPGIAPGEKSPLMVVITQPDGKVLEAEGVGHGKVLWKDLQVTASVVTANEKGILSLGSEDQRREGGTCHDHGAKPSGHPHGTRHPSAVRLQVQCKFPRQQRLEWHGRQQRAGRLERQAWAPSIRITRPRAETARTRAMAWTARMEDLAGMRRRCRSGWRSGQGAIPCSRSVFLHQATKRCSGRIPREVP
jgi:hypothetical protein